MKAQITTGNKFMVSIQFSHSVVFDSLWPHEPQHARPPCPSPTPGVHPNPCPPVGDAIQPSHPLSSPSPPDLNPSKHQCLFRWVTFLHQVAKVLEFQLQHQSYQWTPRTDLLSFNKPFKRHMLSFLLTNIDSILRSRDITLPKKVCLVKAIVFPVVMYVRVGV